MPNEYYSRHRQYQLIKPGFGLRYLIRIWGVFTAFGTYALGATSQLYNHKIAGLLIVLTSFLILILEIKWLIRFLLLKCCCNGVIPEHFIWVFCTTLGEMCSEWRLSFPYVVLGIAFLIWNQKIWLSFAVGAQLLILSMLRLLTVLRCQAITQEENLLPQYNFEKIIDGINGENKVPSDYLKASLDANLENIEPLEEIC